MPKFFIENHTKKVYKTSEKIEDIQALEREWGNTSEWTSGTLNSDKMVEEFNLNLEILKYNEIK